LGRVPDSGETHLTTHDELKVRLAEKERWTIGHRLLHTCMEELTRRTLLFAATDVLNGAPPVIPRPWYDEFVYSRLIPGSFFTLTAPATLVDYQAAIRSLNRVLALGEASVELEKQKAKSPKGRTQKTSMAGAPDWKSLRRLLEGLEAFAEERVLARFFPLVSDTTEHHLIGPLKSRFLADSPDALHAKYGVSLVDGLTVFGQVAHRPYPILGKDESDSADAIANAGPEAALETALEAALALQPQFGATARWPFVTFTPIGIFRLVPDGALEQ
jgi:hypothetical protein